MTPRRASSTSRRSDTRRWSCSSCGRGIGGSSWSDPEWIDPPLVGPAFEMCHSLVEVRDGRWLAPTSTWMGWDGDAPNGMNAVLLVSHDQGRTWPDYITEFDRWSENILHWEQGFIELQDGRWVSAAWAVDLNTFKVQPTPYAMSHDRQTFDHHGLTGFRGQTTKLTELPDGRVLAIYRRDDKPGLWATVARLDGDEWVNLDTGRLWAGQPSGMTGATNPRRGARAAQVRLPADGGRAGRRRVRRVLVRGGLHQEHPLAAPYGVRVMRGVSVRANVGVAARDGTRLVHRPVSAGGGDARPSGAHPHAVRQHAAVPRREGPPTRRPRLRRRDPGLSGPIRLGWHLRAVPNGGARRLRHHRVARRAAVVRRARGHGRPVLCRVDAVDGGAANERPTSGPSCHGRWRPICTAVSCGGAARSTWAC